MRKLKITELQRLTPEEFKRETKTPLVVVLDNVRSLHNVGSVFRTADAFRLEKIVLCGITSAPPNPEIHKSALGAEFSVAWEYEEYTVQAIEKLKMAGYKVFAVEQATESVMIDSEKFTQLFADSGNEKYAIIFGNEVHGVQQSVINQCDNCIEIPQFGTKHSLNVSVSAGIVIWETFKRIKAKFL
jgi:tRNA G18 (ribose-2'-O)-methylase SpoU